MHSSDGGATWPPQMSNATDHLFAVWGVGGTVFAAGESGTILETVDGGAMWMKQTVGMEQLHSIWGSGPKDVYVVGGTAILHSSDGVTFAPETSPDPGGQAVWGSAASDVYVVGASNDIQHSTDSGAHWLIQPSGTLQPLDGVWGSGPGDLYAVGSSGTILHKP